MATSGSSDFAVTRDDIINMAARKIQAAGIGITMSADMRADFAMGLNSMVKAWAAKQLHIWTVSEAILFPQVSQVKYGMGTGATDHVTGTYYQTTISANEALAQTTISLTSTANITAADKIGIVQDDGTVLWSTVTSKTSTTVLIANALTDSAAAGNYVWNYTVNIVRPLKIVAARRYNVASGIETPLVPMLARNDYMALPNKTQTGSINQAFYDPQLAIGYLYIWNPPAVVDTLLKFTYYRPIQDFDSAGDAPDLPIEWVNPLVFNLAVLMAPDFSVPMEKFQQVKALADQFLDDAEGFDREAESITFGVDTSP